MNYRYCFGMLMCSETADAFYFQEGEKQEIVTSIVDHSMTIKFRKGQRSRDFSNYFLVLNDDVPLQNEKFYSHEDKVIWNSCRIFNKTEKPWIVLNVFITKGILEEPIVVDEDTSTTIVTESLDAEAFKTVARKSKNLLFDFPINFKVANLKNLMIQNERVVTTDDTTPYQIADFSVTSLDYLEAFKRYLVFKLPDIKVVQRDSDEQVEGFDRIITIAPSNNITKREFMDTHVMYDDKLGPFMRVQAELQLEFLSNDVTYAQEFEHDFNSDLGIRQIQSFTIQDKYGVDNPTPDLLSPNGWSATCLWQDFVEFDPDNRTQSKTFQGSSLYCIPFTCTLSFFIVKGIVELPDILAYILKTYVSIGDSNE